MDQYSSAIKNTLLVIVFTVLLLPLAQSNLHLFKVKDLKGYFVSAEDIKFKKDIWFSNEFQAKKEKFVTENFGFRNALVRVMNQIRFVLFEKSTNPEVFFGKENYMCTKIYLASYKGEYYAGTNAIIEKCFLVKELQDRLEKKGKIYLPVIAPNKVNFYSEYLADGAIKKGLTNYEAYKYCFDKLKIKYIDFESYFLSIKKTSKYPLFSKYGIHWSTYGHYIAADSIINFLNTQYQLNTNKLIVDKNIELSDSLKDFDYDLGESLNLFINQLPSEKFAYPKYQFTKRATNKPSLLVIGDSFNFGLELTDMQHQVFSDYKLLYYFKELLPYTGDKDAFKKLNIKDEINNHQIILTLFTEQNFSDYGCGFIEKAINILNEKDSGSFDDFENKVLEMIKNIKENKDWLTKLTNQANEEHKNLDSLMRQNAIYVVNINISEEKKIRDQKIKEMIDYIKKNSEWMKSVEQRSKETGAPIDSILTKDAIYQVDINNK